MNLPKIRENTLAIRRWNVWFQVQRIANRQWERIRRNRDNSHSSLTRTTGKTRIRTKRLQFVIPQFLKDLPIWDQILRLPLDPTWNAFANIICVVTAYYYTYNAAAEKCILSSHFKKSVLYFFEVFYTMDVILTLISMIVQKLSCQEMNLPRRPILMLAFEMFSLYPLETLSSYKEYRDRVMHCSLKINRSIRIIKVYYFYKCYFRTIDDAIYIRIMQIFTNIIMLLLFSHAIYCNMYCMRTQHSDCCTFITIWTILSKIVSVGLIDYRFQGVVWRFILFLTMFVAFFIRIFATTHLTIIAIENMLEKRRYNNLFRSELVRLGNYNLPPHIMKSFRDSFALTWKNCGGFNEDKSFFRYIPRVTANEALLNISWGAFWHSKLFGDAPLPHLRHLAGIVKHCSYMPGEFVFKKNEIKDKMVYVVSGTIHLLSEDDSESAILSLCSGTCIGESSLFISYMSKNHVYCDRFCELHIIERKDFNTFNRSHPELYNHFKRTIRERYRDARRLKKLKDYTRSLIDDTERGKDTYTMVWIKNTLHTLMSIDKDSTTRHELQNIYIEHDTDIGVFKKMAFCPDYLDELTITERFEVENDTVFMRTSFPWVLQPRSIVIYINEVFMTIATIAVSCTLPYMCFVAKEVPYNVLVIISTVTIYNWLDLYIQISTGVHTKQGPISKISSIVALKLETLCFWCDLLSCVPLEFFSPILLEVMSDQNKATLRLNRLLKLYRLYLLCYAWEDGWMLNPVLIRYFKFFCMYMYIIYFFSCVLVRLYPEMRMVDVVFCAVQLVTTLGLMTGKTFTDRAVLFCLLDLLFFSIRTVMYCQIISAYITAAVYDIYMKEMCKDILGKLRRYQISEKYGQRTVRFLATQDLHKIIFEKSAEFFYVAGLRKSIDDDMKEYVLTDALTSHVFFQLFSGECLRDICTIMQPMILPKNEVLIYAGDISSVVYVVRVGIFTTYDADGSHVKLSRGDRVINLLPAIFKASSPMSYVTVTDCRIIYFDIGRFRCVLTKYPQFLTVFDALIAGCGDISEQLRWYAEIEAVTDITSALDTKEKSYYFYGFNHQVDSFEEADYELPFDQLYPFGFIRLCLMRVTFLPNGRFVHIWEIFRSIFAILTSLLVFTPPAFMSTIGTAIIIFLDVAAFVDIYIRMHVCYYNELGILVKHPLKTVAHYFTHSFFVDLIAAFPFKYLPLTDYRKTEAFFASRINCLLQLHRYVQYVMTLHANSVPLPNVIYCVAYVPMLIVAANFLGCLLNKLECNFESNLDSANFTGGLHCREDSVLAISPFVKPITPWRAHFYGTYIFVSVLTTTAWQGYTLGNDRACIMVMILSVVGLYCTVYIFAYVVSFYANHYRPLLQYQELMRHLKRFMIRVNVNKKLRKHVIKICEKYWAHSRGQPVNEVVEFLYPTLKLDILYDCYGAKAFYYSIFENKNKNFYRNMLQYGWTDIVMKDEYVMTLNQLTKMLKIVLDGVVDVIGPDGVQITTLYPGSMFGNLENREYIRAKNTIIAATHTEIFLIPAKKFYKLLLFYPKMGEDFFKLKSTNVSYIRSNMRDRYLMRTASREQKLESIFTHVFNPNSKAIHLWHYTILIFPCFLGILVDFYQLGAGNFSYYILIIQYISDVLYGIDYLLINRIGYEDHKGTMVMDRWQIKRKNRERRWKNTISLISLVPLDIFVLVYPFPSNIKSIIYACCRLNRLLRIVNVFGLFNSLNRKLNVNVEAVTMFRVTVWAMLYLTGVAALIGVVGCSFEMNMYPPIPKCIDLHDPGVKNRTSIFVRLLLISSNSLLLNVQRRYVPYHAGIIVLFAIVMVFGHFVHGICLAQMFETLFGKHLPKYLYRSVFKRLKFFIASEDLSVSLRRRIESTMASLWDTHEGVLRPILLDKRPMYLKDAVFNDAFCHLMREHPLFKNCHTDCLKQIVNCFQFRPFYHGDYIQLENCSDGRMFMLIYGKIAVLTNVDTNINDFVDVLEGDARFFGILPGIYPRTAHAYTYRSIVAQTYVAYLRWNDWIHILDFFPASKKLIYEAAKNYKGY